MSKTSRFTGKAGARFEDQGCRIGPIENRGSGIDDRLKKLENKINKKTNKEINKLGLW